MSSPVADAPPSTLLERGWRLLVEDFRAQSGPATARLFHRLLALVFLDAWISLGVQVQELIGQRGLLPIADFLDVARANDLTFAEFPTHFWISAGDRAISCGIWAGVTLSLLALAGFAPRVSIGLSTVLYLGYATACRTFTGFQWDNLILECGALAILLPRDRPARFIHMIFRLVLFKLYFESGIAKWQSHLHDWQDGSAMTHYYETAPLPTWVAWYAHALPVAWHHFESFATLVFELVLPFFFFATKWPRRATAVFLTLFQIINAATANYGFFCYLATALHVFLLDERDVLCVAGWASQRLSLSPRPPPQVRPHDPTLRGLAVFGGALVTAIFVTISVADGIDSFARWDRFAEAIAPAQRRWAPFRLVNTYHLFGHITTARIEPEIQTFDGATWTARDLRHKAGDPYRAPDFVAPHQPRLDFQLWFYGLGYRGGSPEYVITLVDRVCNDPSAVEKLFAASLPPKPAAVRIVYFHYQFTTPEERRTTGEWWKREQLGETRPVACGKE